MLQRLTQIWQPHQHEDPLASLATQDAGATVLELEPPCEETVSEAPVVRDPLKKISDYRFSPNNRDLITFFDNTAIRIVGRFARDWQDVSGDDHGHTIYRVRQARIVLDVLPMALSSTLIGTGAMLLLSHAAALATVPHGMRSPLAEENQLVATNQHPHTGRYIRLMFLGAFSAVSGIGLQPFLQEPNLLSFGLAVQFLTFLTYPLEFYLAYADFPKPPPRTLPRRALDRAKQFVTRSPQPALQPAPVRK